MISWFYDFMVYLWFCYFVIVWFCDFMILSFCDCMIVWFYYFVFVCFYDFIIFWFRDFIILWFYDSMILLLIYWTALYFCGACVVYTPDTISKLLAIFMCFNLFYNNPTIVCSHRLIIIWRRCVSRFLSSKTLYFQGNYTSFSLGPAIDVVNRQKGYYACTVMGSDGIWHVTVPLSWTMQLTCLYLAHE